METSETVWLSLTALAERPGNGSKANVSKRIKAWRASGDLKDGRDVRVDAKGIVRAVDVARFELLRDQHTDPTRNPGVAAASDEPAAPIGGTLSQAKLEEAQIRAIKARYELAEMQGILCRKDFVAQYGQELAGVALEVMNEGPGHSEDVLAAYQEHGVSGFNKAFRAMFRTLRAEMAARLEARAREADQGDPEPPLHNLLMAAE